jgi:fructose-bisphosphate aldolase class I
MRSRIATAPAFTGEKVIGAILFEKTMDREIGGKPSARFPWEDRGVVPFLKIDKGLEAEENGVQLMKPIPGLDDLLDRAVAHGIFGTKERSVISAANEGGIAAIVEQQFELGQKVLAKGLVPILEPEVTISIGDKAEAEDMLLAEILKHLETQDEPVMLKLSLPTLANLYAPLIAHPKVLRVVALSGGYARDEANAKLAENTGMIASFSRALTEGLSAQQSDAEFNATIAETISAIHAASIT